MTTPLDELCYTFADDSGLRIRGDMLVLFGSPALAQHVARTAPDRPRVVQVRVIEATRHEQPEWYALTMRRWWGRRRLWQALGMTQLHATRPAAEEHAASLRCQVTPVLIDREKWTGIVADWQPP